MKNKRMLGNFILLFTALIWGCAFPAQSVASKNVEPFTFMALRSALGTLVLIPTTIIMSAIKKRDPGYTAPTKANKLFLLKGGIACGAVLTLSTVLQQIGLTLGTTSGKSGFITAMYILLVPVFGLILKKKVRPIIWLSVALGVVGLYLLCMKDGFTLAPGDFYTMLCAAVFAIHILIVDHFSPGTDGVKLSLIQFATMTVISGVIMLLFENPDWAKITEVWLPICYVGIMSSGVAYTLQIVGQKNTEPAIASLLMSFESVFAMLAGIMLLHEIPTLAETIGSAIMFAAVIMAQLPEKRRHSVK